MRGLAPAVRVGDELIDSRNREDHVRDTWTWPQRLASPLHYNPELRGWGERVWADPEPSGVETLPACSSACVHLAWVYLFPHSFQNRIGLGVFQNSSKYFKFGAKIVEF